LPDRATIFTDDNVTRTPQKARQDRQIKKEAESRKRTEKKTRRQSDAPAQESQQPEGLKDTEELDLLPDDILHAIAEKGGSEDEEIDIIGDSDEEDRREYEKRIVSEQLRQGLLQSKKRSFSEKDAGPVTVRVLNKKHQSATQKKSRAAAKTFLEQRLYAGVPRSSKMLKHASFKKSRSQKFVHF